MEIRRDFYLEKLIKKEAQYCIWQKEIHMLGNSLRTYRVLEMYMKTQ